MNSSVYGAYEAVIGLEVHAELKTKTKIFCSCATDFGKEPNTQCCPVCMGLPGALPVLNRRVIELAVRAGLALNCRISERCTHERKNYFYPDLPKAYQISQLHSPLCYDGHLDIETEHGTKRIGIERIHIEEDAGKLIHSDAHGTMIDCNRCGIPLIEIVSCPDMRSAKEARAYLEKLRSVLLFADVSDCRMNEGSLRCDINISVRARGDTALHTRTEIKNLNSFAYAAKAIEYEIQRQTALLERGCSVRQETRRYDERSGATVLMRAKENADDYRYFTDPDLPAFSLSGEQIETIRLSLGRLADERRAQYASEFGLGEDDCRQLVTNKALADFFEAVAPITKYPKHLASLLLCEAPTLTDSDSFSCPISKENLASLCDLLGDGKINSSTAKSLLSELWEHDGDPIALVDERALSQINDESTLLKFVRQAISEGERAVSDYRRGKRAAARALVGRTMALTGGRANPALALELIERLLNETSD